MDTSATNLSTRQVAIGVLAVIGFITLIGAGMWLAVYSTRFVPSVVNRIGAAAVYLGSVFRLDEAPNLSVVQTPVASTTISFGDASSNIPTSASSTPNKPVASTASTQSNWTPGTPVAFTSGNISSPAPANYHGLPDLSVQIETIGYTIADGSIVSTTTIPAYKQGAVKFRVTNIGTNVSGPWTVNISVPGRTLEQTMSSLVPAGPNVPPNEYIAYFISVAPGVDRAVIITIDPNHQLSESSTANNSATTSVTILGS